MTSDARPTPRFGGQARLPVQVCFTPEFKRNIRLLARKYRHIRADIEPVIEVLGSGNIIGDKIPGTSYTIFKVRIINSDIQKGKSSGYRLIYFLKNPAAIILVTIYSKLEQSDISAGDVRRILRGWQ